MSLISFVGVCLLGLLQSPKLGSIVEYTCLAFAAVVLVADALLHLLPHALEGADHEQMSSIGLSAVAGSLFLLVVPELCEWHGHKHGHCVAASGVANLVVEMLHNFIDGIAIGLAHLASPTAGLHTAVAVAAHELPQELGDFMVLRSAGFPIGRLLAWNFAASLTCVGGVAAVQLVGQEATMRLQQRLMAFTAGSFLTLALGMLYPQVLASIKARHKEASSAAAAKLLCLVVGGVAIAALLYVGELEGEEHSHGHDHGHGHGQGHAHSHAHSHKEL